MLAPRLRRDGGPYRGVGDQPRVHGFAGVGDVTGEPERQAFFAAECRVDADDRDHIHDDADIGAEHHGRTEDRPGETALRRLGLDVVLLQPVEVRVVVAGVTFPGGNADGVQVDSVGFGPLQHGDVFQPRGLGQRLDQVLQHRQVGVHLLLVLPAGNQPRFFVDGRVDDVADAVQLAEALLAGPGVPQVHRQVRELALAEDLRLAPGHGDDVPAGG